MSYNEADEFFDEYAPTRGGAPAFKFENVGDTVKGKIVSLRQMDQTVFRSNPPQPIPDPKRPGQNKKQLQIILETSLRNWEGCNPGKDADGNPQPPSEDTGARAIYVKGWMIGAVADAVQEATGKRGAPKAGGRLAVRFSESADTDKGNPLKKFLAKYEPPSEGDSFFEEAEAEDKARVAEATKPAAQQSLDLDDDEEPPF